LTQTQQHLDGRDFRSGRRPQSHRARRALLPCARSGSRWPSSAATGLR